MIELLPHLLFTLEALEEDDVALQLRVRDLERDLGAADAVDGPEDRRHPAAGQELTELILIELLSGDGLAHQRSARTDMAVNLPWNAETETRFELEVATLTDVGTERENNEDRCGELLESPGCGLLVVADGVSSAEAGETASQTAVTATVKAFGEQPAGTSTPKRLYPAPSSRPTSRSMIWRPWCRSCAA